MELLPIILIVLVLVLGIGALIFIRRRRAAEDIPLPDIGDPVDYTSPPPEEEPEPDIRERFNALPLPAKIAIFASPLVIIGLIVIMIVVSSLTGPSTGGNGQDTPTDAQPAPPPSLEIGTADLVSEDAIRLSATTNLPEGTNVQISLLSGDAPFDWLSTDSTNASVESGKVEKRLSKKPDALRAPDDVTYTLVLSATAADGQVAEARKELAIPDNLKSAFFVLPPATPTPEPGPADTPPTEVPTLETPPTGDVNEETSLVEPTEDVPEPQPIPIGETTATVANGGNVRAIPGGEPILDQVHANESVELLKKTPDGQWYFMRNPRDTEGWVHQSLLTISAEVDANVPVEGSEDMSEPMTGEGDDTEPTPAATDEGDDTTSTDDTGTTSAASVRVFNGGNVRQTPGGEPILDQVNANEQVELLKKTADGVWFFIKNERNVEGWVHYTLLDENQLQSVASQIPVEE